jgi:hypothetical protein
MNQTFERDGRVTWNSEAGRMTGIIRKKTTSEVVFKAISGKPHPY